MACSVIGISGNERRPFWCVAARAAERSGRDVSGKGRFGKEFRCMAAIRRDARKALTPGTKKLFRH